MQSFITLRFSDPAIRLTGEKELATLMEHFEPLFNPRNAVFGGPDSIRNSLKVASKSLSPQVLLRGRTTISSSSVDKADRVRQLHAQWLDKASTKVTMEAYLLRTGFDVRLLETSLTAESYYDSKKTEVERKRTYRAIVTATPSEELMSVQQCDLAEYFDPEVKFPGRQTCLSSS